MLVLKALEFLVLAILKIVESGKKFMSSFFALTNVSLHYSELK